MGEEDMKEFFVRLERAWVNYRSNMKKRQSKQYNQANLVKD
jgi:hypothetical protein